MKFLTYMVVSQFFWVISYLPFLPPNPIQLILVVWILVPTHKGEAVVYLVLESYLLKFEYGMRYIRNYISEKILFVVLTIAEFTVTNLKSRTSYEMAKYFREVTESMDHQMAAEIQVKARLHTESDSDGVPEVTNFVDVADSTGAYKRKKGRPAEGVF